MENKLSETLQILSTPIAFRKPEMIKILVDLTRTISFFINLISELGERMHYQICEFLSGEFFSAGSV